MGHVLRVQAHLQQQQYFLLAPVPLLLRLMYTDPRRLADGLGLQVHPGATGMHWPLLGHPRCDSSLPIIPSQLTLISSRTSLIQLPLGVPQLACYCLAGSSVQGISCMVRAEASGVHTHPPPAPDERMTK